MRYTITSPYTHNDTIRKIQNWLKSKGYLQGPVDGVFGPDTARAVYRAKYWFGYDLKNLDQIAGDYFQALITGGKQPTQTMRARIDARSKQARNQPVREKMIAEAAKWIGTKESPPNTNHVKFTAWYGMVGPWCAMFVTWCGVTVNSKAFVRGQRYAYVPYVVNDGRAGRNGLAVTYKPLKGDLVCFDWNGDKIADHIGFFDHWITQGKEFATIEGNTAVGNDSNGGEVMRRNRTMGTVQAFIHVSI
jgi:hypothetical protein